MEQQQTETNQQFKLRTFEEACKLSGEDLLKLSRQVERELTVKVFKDVWEFLKSTGVKHRTSDFYLIEGRWSSESFIQEFLLFMADRSDEASIDEVKKH